MNHPHLPEKRVWKMGDTVDLIGNGLILLDSPEAVEWANSAIRPEELPGYEEFLVRNGYL